MTTATCITADKATTITSTAGMDSVHATDCSEWRGAENGAGDDMPDAADPATADAPTAERPSERSARVGDIAGIFASIRVSYPPQNLLVAALDEARHTAMSIRERRAATGQRIPMNVMRTIAHMGVGKTWGAEKLRDLCNPVDPEDTSRPVLLVTLDTSGKQTSLPQGILKELKVRGWNHGNDPELLWSRAIDAMRDHGVELLIVDEINRAARRPSIGPVIGGDIMDLLVNGDVGVAFMGTEEALKVFNRCQPLKDRMKAPVVMKALDWLIPQERETFTDFLAKMDQALVDHGLATELAGLGDDPVAKPLWEVCRGRLRPLCLLLEEAVTALHREQSGAGVLTVQILAQAVEDHSIPNEHVEYNPFTEEKPA
jgi:hypothetical protein